MKKKSYFVHNVFEAPFVEWNAYCSNLFSADAAACFRLN